MTTANDYYTQPEAEAMFISLHDVQNAEEAQYHNKTLSLREQGILHFGNQQDIYTCRQCYEKKGWHWYAGPADGSDFLSWEGDFYVTDEDGERILCEYCFADLTSGDYDEEPAVMAEDEGPANILDTLPAYTLACMDFIDKISNRNF